MNLTNTCHKISLLLLFVFGVYNAHAQRADSLTYKANQTYVWGGFHFGGGSFMFNTGADAAAVFKRDFMVAARADINANLHLFSSPSTTKEAAEYALMFGYKLTRQPYSNLFLLSGISAVRQQDRGDYVGEKNGLFRGGVYGDDKVYKSMGVPIELKYLLPPTNFFAMDFSASANINPHRTFFSLTFGLGFGKIRSGEVHGPPPANRQPPGMWLH